MSNDLLKKYNKKRDFGITAEPKGKPGKRAKTNLRFVIQLHEATRTHYDFRLEWDGIIKSWAVTKGPSFDPADKRLAVRTEDHPVDYNDFEGVIPDKQYGAGPVMIWDEGIWTPEDDPDKMEKMGRINFSIEGSRMKGQWHFVRLHTPDKRENWLLIKSKDDFALYKTMNADFLKRENTSIVTGRTMDQIRKAGLGKTTKRNNKALKIESAESFPKPKKEMTKPTLFLDTFLKKYEEPELATLVDHQPDGEAWFYVLEVEKTGRISSNL